MKGAGLLPADFPESALVDYGSPAGGAPAKSVVGDGPHTLNLPKVEIDEARARIASAVARDVQVLGITGVPGGSQRSPLAVVVRAIRGETSNVDEKIAGEDCLAAELLVAMLPPSVDVTLHVINDEDEEIPEVVRRGNLILLGGGFRNPEVRRLLADPGVRQRAVFMCENEGTASESWALAYGDETYRSKFWIQQVEFVDRRLREPLQDVALLSRFVNPVNDAATVILVAGVRRLGTLGAAQAFRAIREDAKMAAAVAAAEFSCIVDVERESPADPARVKSTIVERSIRFWDHPDRSRR